MEKVNGYLMVMVPQVHPDLREILYLCDDVCRDLMVKVNTTFGYTTEPYVLAQGDETITRLVRAGTKGPRFHDAPDVKVRKIITMIRMDRIFKDLPEYRYCWICYKRSDGAPCPDAGHWSL